MACSARREVMEYTINLDLPPKDRYTALVPTFNATVWEFYNKFFANDKAVTDALYALVLARGKEPQEMQEEIDGLAEASKLPARFVAGIQMMYELQTTMVPVVNVTEKAAPLPFGFEGIELPWRGPGCK